MVRAHQLRFSSWVRFLLTQNSGCIFISNSTILVTSVLSWSASVSLPNPLPAAPGSFRWCILGPQRYPFCEEIISTLHSKLPRRLGLGTVSTAHSQFCSISSYKENQRACWKESKALGYFYTGNAVSLQLKLR